MFTIAGKRSHIRIYIDLPATNSKEPYPRIRSHNNRSWSVDRYPEKARTIHLKAIRNLRKIHTQNETHQNIHSVDLNITTLLCSFTNVKV